jgi:methionyl-tRNA synthetase
VGFALELVQADALVRYQRLLGRTVRFQTGTDENAFKNVLSARARGVPVEQLVDENAARFQALCTQLGISYDRFLRTTEPAHQIAVHAFLRRLRAGDVYEHTYRGLYCPGCEDFHLERDLVDSCCPDHGAVITQVNERNYFFRLSNYQAQLEELITTRRIRIEPEARGAEVLQFVRRGLADISISRDANRSAGWGIDYPGDSTQVVYVWIDALVNYLTGLDWPGAFPDRPTRKWGGSPVWHIIGKNVWKFHAVYWPALLLSAGLSVPDRIITHGFLTIDGKKISKSGAPAPDPAEHIDRYGADALRYFLLRHVRPFSDTDFSKARLREVYEADLANGLGNLASRLAALCEHVELPAHDTAETPAAPAHYHDHINEYRFDRALDAIWEEIGRIDREIAHAQPWQDVRAGRHERARALLRDWSQKLLALTFWLSPFLPATARSIQAAFSAARIRKGAPLFPRVPADV